jgi:fermentation-respiration switch protein FrsA (DUF1100 family)
MAPTEPSNADILAALGQLVTVVGSLAETVAQLADPGSGPAAPAQPSAAHIKFSTDPGFAPLVPLDGDNVDRRTRLADDLGILGEPLGAELIRHGARGFYRLLDRDNDRCENPVRRDLAIRLVEDATLEDPEEAKDMGRDLLMVWDATDEADFIAPNVMLAD